MNGADEDATPRGSEGSGVVPGGAGDVPGLAPAPAEHRSGASRILGWVLEPTHAQTQVMARVVGPVFVVCAALLVPWTVYLFRTLPSRQVSHHYDLAWGGFDVALAAALVGTAWATVRLSRALPIAATALGTLLLVDAWFDIVTSRPGGDLVLAIVMGLVAELPLAAVAFWLAYHGQSLRERAIAVRLLRAVRLGRPVARPFVRIRGRDR